MRADTLMEVYGYDNSSFINYLSAKGFYVASRSRSNYPYTILSIPSSLNMEYVNYLTDTVGPDSTDYTATVPLIQNNRVVRLLKSIGYRYVLVGNNWFGTDWSDLADEIPRWEIRYQGDRFVSLLYETTILFQVTGVMFPRTWYGQRGNDSEAILFAFEYLPQLGNRRQPTFVYAHLIAPHPPYLFGANGEPAIEPEGGWSKAGSKQAYLEQLIFVYKKVQQLVDVLLAESNRPPIIIIQSDHGTAWEVDKNLYPESSLDVNIDLDHLYGILNAYYWPNNGGELLDESITPVNTYRLLFNEYFGTELEMLPERSYFSYFDESPFRFIDVTDLLEP